MVSSTLCPAVHILCSQNVYSRAEGIADRYWPWVVFGTHCNVHRFVSWCICNEEGHMPYFSICPIWPWSMISVWLKSSLFPLIQPRLVQTTTDPYRVLAVSKRLEG